MNGNHGASVDRNRQAGTAPVVRGRVRGNGGTNGKAQKVRDPQQRIKSLEKQVGELERERRELEQALYGAAQVQRKLCAPREIRRGRFEIAGEIFPARHLSADFYNVLELGNETGLAVGDIEGKGIAAGLWFTYVVGLVRIYSSAFADPAAAVAAINRDLFQVPSGPPMAGVFLARLDAERGVLEYCNAGQPPALVLRRDGGLEMLEEGGPVLGAFPDSTYKRGRVELHAGDTFICCSDGITECENRQEEEFGMTGLMDAVKKSGRVSASMSLYSLFGAVQDFSEGHPRGDDLTLLVARHTGGWVRN